MPRVVFISDTHTQHRNVRLPDGDLLVHAGDMTYTGGISSFASFNDWLGEQKDQHGYKDVVVIPGNHDLTAEKQPELVRSILTEATMLINQSATVQGLKIWGSPFTPFFCDWAFMLPRGSQLQVLWSGIPEGLDILITHGPPKNVGDKVYMGGNVGCYDLMERVKKVQPRYHVFGHIHETHGTYTVPGINTVFINASVVNHKYQVANPPIVVEFPDVDQTVPSLQGDSNKGNTAG